MQSGNTCNVLQIVVEPTALYRRLTVTAAWGSTCTGRVCHSTSHRHTCPTRQEQQHTGKGACEQTRHPTLLTYVADSSAELFLHSHDLIHNLVRLQIPGEPPLASCAEGAAQRAPDLHSRSQLGPAPTIVAAELVPVG